jgi:hypothetical protein
MTRALLLLVAGTAALGTAPARAQDHSAEGKTTSHALGVDVFVSTDADKSQTYRAGINFDLHYVDPERHWGFRYEKAWYQPLGDATTSRDRGYLLYADRNRAWAWNTQIGTDGHSVIGSASVHNDKPLRQEYFVERDVVDTAGGLRDGIYYTFVGAALDVPVDSRNSFSAVAGAQAFTGKNVRLHLRGTYTHVVKTNWGLSAQLRGRYFHSTVPGEHDYYSPRWYAQVLPTLQLRRYSAGWRYMISGGLGMQRDANGGWGQSRAVAAELTSPSFGRGWHVKASAQYTNTPLATGIYDYAQLSFALTRAF